VEGLVREHEGAERLLPRGKVGRAHGKRARADEWAEHGVVLAKIGVRPSEGGRPIRIPLRLRRAANLSHSL
jgi:hypothetical protein